MQENFGAQGIQERTTVIIPAQSQNYLQPAYYGAQPVYYNQPQPHSTEKFNRIEYGQPKPFIQENSYQ
jgi:hypothetical protein